MNSAPISQGLGAAPPAGTDSLLAGDSSAMNREINRPVLSSVGWHALVILAGAGAFGASIGLWRSPVQALYSAIKFPLILLCCAAGNALLNGLLGMLLKSRLSIRDSALSILISFSLAAMILGSLSPLILFYAWNIPPNVMGGASSTETYSGLMVLTVCAIAFAGIASNLRLFNWLKEMHASTWMAGKLLVCWLGGNLLLGTQLTWILRPFFGSPGLEVQFLRPDAFHGNFFQALAFAIRRILEN